MKKQYSDDDIRENLSTPTIESAVIEAKIQEAYEIIREKAGEKENMEQGNRQNKSKQKRRKSDDVKWYYH